MPQDYFPGAQPNPLDLRRLRHLCAAVNEGSLSAAALLLGLSQPALSASIKSLEEDLGVRLLDRHRFGVYATSFAETLLEHTESVEAELTNAWSTLLRSRKHVTLSLRIGCGPSEATRLLPLALQQLRIVQPELRVFVEYGLNEVLMPMVRHGQVDCALSSIPQSAPHPDLQHESLCQEQAVIVARTGHPLTRQANASVKDLVRYPWVLARRWELERKAFDDFFAEAGMMPIEAEIETTSAILMKTLVMNGDFLTFVPREMIYWEERANLLCPLKVFSTNWDRHVGITTRSDKPQTESVQWLIAALRKVASELGSSAADQMKRFTMDLPPV